MRGARHMAKKFDPEQRRDASIVDKVQTMAMWFPKEPTLNLPVLRSHSRAQID